MTDVRMEGTYIPSDDIVAREIEGEVIIVPLISGIGDLDDELYTLNETGKAIWKQLDGKKTLNQLVDALGVIYEARPDELRADVVGLMTELLRRRIVVEI